MLKPAASSYFEPCEQYSTNTWLHPWFLSYSLMIYTSGAFISQSTIIHTAFHNMVHRHKTKLKTNLLTKHWVLC